MYTHKDYEVNFAMNEKTKQLKNPLWTWFLQNVKNVLSNVRYRILFLVFVILSAVALLFLLSYVLNLTTNWVLQIFLLLYFLFPLYMVFSYGHRSYSQILYELSLNASIHSVRKEIKKLRERRKQRQEEDVRPLQVKVNKVRIDLKNFIDFSEILTPPIYNYELDRLQKGIDVLFNSISEVLFPMHHVFSQAQKIEQQQTLDYYDSLEHPTKEELEEQWEEMQKEEMGEIDWFDFYALDEFLQYLGDVLFTRTKAYSPFSKKHPINLILLSRFFDYWNSVVSSCRNCKSTYEKARKDVEEYYRLLGRRELQRRQRMRRLIDDLLIVIISVAVSTIVNYLIKFP